MGGTVFACSRPGAIPVVPTLAIFAPTFGCLYVRFQKARGEWRSRPDLVNPSSPKMDGYASRNVSRCQCSIHIVTSSSCRIHSLGRQITNRNRNWISPSTPLEALFRGRGITLGHKTHGETVPYPRGMWGFPRSLITSSL